MDSSIDAYNNLHNDSKTSLSERNSSYAKLVNAYYGMVIRKFRHVVMRYVSRIIIVGWEQTLRRSSMNGGGASRFILRTKLRGKVFMKQSDAMNTILPLVWTCDLAQKYSIVAVVLAVLIVILPSLLGLILPELRLTSTKYVSLLVCVFCCWF